MSADSKPTAVQLIEAVKDFHDARRKGDLEVMLDHLTGKSSELLSYDEIRQRMRAVQMARRRLEEIPLDQIVGSVNRYTDFTRSFLPLQESDLDRWSRVRAVMETPGGFPPIEAYKIGDVYFVLDGNHRVSVAKALGMKTIEGFVTPVITRVPITPDDSADDIILKSEYTGFLNATALDELRPGADLKVTAPGEYQKLLEHIAVHRYFMGEQRGAEVPESEAVLDWYERVYLPIEKLIHNRNLLREFPGRSAADLYLWLMEYRVELSGGGLGWEVTPERASSELAARFSPVPRRRWSRLARRVRSALLPDTLDSGPEPGAWRADAPRRADHLFDDILVALKSVPYSQSTLKLAIEVARRENARLTGIHVVKDEAEKDSPEAQAVKEEFMQACSEAGLFSRMLMTTGQVASVLNQWSRRVDLTIFRLSHPPPDHALERLNSGARLLIRRSSGPLWAVPGEHMTLGSALLSYGPGRKADEALYVATYLAGSWKIPLTVVTVGETSLARRERAASYLEQHGVHASFIEESGDPARAVLLVSEQQDADFLIMGGYESGALRESLMGSTVDRVIRSTRKPILICR